MGPCCRKYYPRILTVWGWVGYKERERERRGGGLHGKGGFRARAEVNVCLIDKQKKDISGREPECAKALRLEWYPMLEAGQSTWDWGRMMGGWKRRPSVESNRDLAKESEFYFANDLGIIK
jgi:hypothetical protein